MIIGLLVAFGVVLVVFLVIRLATVERRVEQLHERLDALDAGPQPATPPIPPATAHPEPAPPVPEPPAFLTPEVPAVEAPPPLHPPPAATPELPVSATPQPSAPRRPKIDFEQLVGGVWLQNVGAVLLLVGFFFLILWGYATGRFGPEMLVIAGVLAGLGLVWRGARMRLSAEGVGHALIGVGAGVVWLAIYVGHFKLRVLPPPVAFAFVVAASVFTGALGIRYGVQLIAALGVVGAHLPGLMKAFMPLYGFTLPASGLLAYLAGLNALVFTLAARMGWSALALASLILTASTWALVVPDSSWSWGTEIGLAVLFAGLGLVPLLRLVRTDGPVRPVDLAVVAVAPLALLVASTPMFQLSAPVHVAMLLGSLAAVYTAAAAWVDQRRPDRDLWRPLVAAAVLFLTFALERAVGPDRTALAWILEGCALVILGRRPRAAWLRWCGYVVVMIGGVRLLPDILYGFDNWSVPLASADSITAGIAMVALLGVPYLLLRDDERTDLPEQFVVHAWLVSAHLMLMLWLAREAGNLAHSLEGDGGAWRGERDIRAAGSSAREAGLFIRATALAWMLQSAWLVHGGVRGGRLVLRLVSYGIAAIVTSALVIVPVVQDSWALDLLPILHRDGLFALATIGIAITMAAYLARNRDALLTVERRIAEVWAAAAALMMLTWISREADHITRTMLDVPGRMSSAWSDVDVDVRQRLRAVAGTITSVGWILQAMIAFVIGWFAKSAFMRWMGMGLVAITVLKFLIVDLATADPFWRFLTAIMAGAAMLALSYVYQRRARKSG